MMQGVEPGKQPGGRQRRFDAVIFDMDGILIDSEPLWWLAEEAAFQAAGVPMVAADGALTMGLRTDEVVEYWYSRHPWTSPSRKEVEASIIGNIIALIQQQGEAMPGARETVAALTAMGMPLGLATSSASDIIIAVLDRLDLTGAFQVTQSAEHELFGKPHPGVYIETVRRLGVSPERCLAIEDSPNGVLAAKAARMQCLAIPPPEMRNDRRYCIADYTLDSLAEFDLGFISGASI